MSRCDASWPPRCWDLGGGVLRWLVNGLAALLAALFARALLTVFFALSTAPPLLFCCRRSREGILRCSRAALLDISPVLSASRLGAAHPEAEFAQSCIETPSHAATVAQRLGFRRVRRLAGSLLAESAWSIRAALRLSRRCAKPAGSQRQAAGACPCARRPPAVLQPTLACPAAPVTPPVSTRRAPGCLFRPR